jgi:hypothetical protein
MEENFHRKIVRLFQPSTNQNTRDQAVYTQISHSWSILHVDHLMFITGKKKTLILFQTSSWHPLGLFNANENARLCFFSVPLISPKRLNVIKAEILYNQYYVQQFFSCFARLDFLLFALISSTCALKHVASTSFFQLYKFRFKQFCYECFFSARSLHSPAFDAYQFVMHPTTCGACDNKFYFHCRSECPWRWPRLLCEMNV